MIGENAPAPGGSPAFAGIDPRSNRACKRLLGFPRVRGDRPEKFSPALAWPWVPPRSRG